jgi:hypothetical protein
MMRRLPKVTVPLTPREIGELAQLLFEWPIRRAPRLALPFFILLAMLIQAGVILLFSIRYGVPAGRLPEAPRFYFIPSGSDAARRLAPWLEANDPSIFSPVRATEAAVPAPPPLRYRPSYEEPPPPPRPLPPERERVLEPPTLPLVGETSPAIHAKPAATPSVTSGRTSVQWMDDLSQRLPGGMETAPTLDTPGASPPSAYQVGVASDGEILCCVLTTSSGDPARDDAGRAWILSRHFPRGSSASWGRVLILWAPVPSGKAETLRP